MDRARGVGGRYGQHDYEEIFKVPSKDKRRESADTVLTKNTAGNHHALYLVGTLVNLADLRIPVNGFQRDFLRHEHRCEGRIFKAVATVPFDKGDAEQARIAHLLDPLTREIFPRSLVYCSGHGPSGAGHYR